jgi:hypothetical protein
MLGRPRGFRQTAVSAAVARQTSFVRPTAVEAVHRRSYSTGFREVESRSCSFSAFYVVCKLKRLSVLTKINWDVFSSQGKLEVPVGFRVNNFFFFLTTGTVIKICN